MQNPFRYFNSSPEIIRLAVMMYVRFPLSLRQVEDLLSERGIDICHETVRYWWNRFGPLFAAEIRRRRVHRHWYSNWRWHLDEVFVRINGKTCSDLRSLAQQPGRELAPAVPTTGSGNGQFQGRKDPAEICFRPCLDPQPLQPRTPSQPPRNFQTGPSRRLGRVASIGSLRMLDCRFYKSCPVSLTMPAGQSVNALGSPLEYPVKTDYSPCRSLRPER